MNDDDLSSIRKKLEINYGHRNQFSNFVCNLGKQIEFFKLEASCPNVEQEWGAKHSTHWNAFRNSQHFSKTLFFKKKLFFSNLTMFCQKQNISATIPLSSGEKIIIWIQILRGIYCLRNDYEQIYLFGNLSSSKSYQLA